jgi:hypothetical protein
LRRSILAVGLCDVGKRIATSGISIRLSSFPYERESEIWSTGVLRPLGFTFWLVFFAIMASRRTTMVEKKRHVNDSRTHLEEPAEE